MMEEQSALHSEELVKRPREPKEQNEDIWQLTMAIRSLREQMEEFERECQRKISEQMCTLEGLLRWCDYLLYQSCKLSSKRSEENIPEGR